MSGRYTLSQPAEALAERFHLDEVPSLESQYNVAPTNPVATVVVEQHSHKRILRLLQWGLIPSWAKDPKIESKMINARSETVRSHPGTATDSIDDFLEEAKDTAQQGEKLAREVSRWVESTFP